MILQKHTDQQYDRELASLKELILKMGGQVETMIAQAMKGLVNRDSALCRSVLQIDKEIDHYEMQIDDLCLRLLALHQPAASDLRFVAMGMKISTDLERMGDLAVNICEQALEINKDEPIKPYIDLPIMAAKSQQMVKGSLDAFVQSNADSAKAICEQDDEVDQLEDKIFVELVQMIEKNPAITERAIRVLIVARQLERIADHATNIAESVNFLVKGQDIRHGAKNG